MNISEKFMKGWNEYDLPSKNTNDWKYAGGNTGRHLNYYKILYPNDDLPERQDNCVCGHFIVENCYIEYQGYFAVLGNCCIKRFIEKCNRTCEICGATHKSRTHNRCKDCKIKKEPPKFRNCLSCNIRIEYEPRKTKCYMCWSIEN